MNLNDFEKTFLLDHSLFAFWSTTRLPENSKVIHAHWNLLEKKFKVKKEDLFELDRLATEFSSRLNKFFPGISKCNKLQEKSFALRKKIYNEYKDKLVKSRSK
jgi:formylmethanofuran dehydrogenase subunit E